MSSLNKASQTILIGLSGAIGAGKTEFCNIAEAFEDAIILNFADTLKEIASLFGFEKKEIYGTQEEKLAINSYWGVSGREFLQKFGTDVCRQNIPIALPNLNSTHGSIWVQNMHRKLTNCIQTRPRLIIVGDCRFADEIQLIQLLGGKIIRITRNRENTALRSSESLHISEQNSQLPYNIEIQNNGSLADYQKKIISCLRELIAR